VNAALAHRRKRANRQAHQSGEPLDAVLDDGDGHPHPGSLRPWSVSPDQPVLDAETHELIEHRPSASCRILIGMCTSWPTLKVCRTAKSPRCWGLSVAAVKSRLHRARLLIRRDALAPHFEEVGIVTIDCRQLCDLLLEYVSGGIGLGSP